MTDRLQRSADVPRWNKSERQTIEEWAEDDEMTFAQAIRRLVELGLKAPKGKRTKRTWAMTIGTVKFFNTERGYGFIAPEGGGPDVFLHISALEAAGLQSVSEGDRVSFDAVMDQRKGKTNAQNVKKLG
jgi:CspA family cold shock protein